MTQVWRWNKHDGDWVQTYDGELLYEFVMLALRDGWTMEGGDEWSDTWFIVP